MKEKQGPRQWLTLAVAIPIIIFINFMFDLGFLPAILIGGAIGGGVGALIHLTYRRQTGG